MVHNSFDFQIELCLAAMAEKLFFCWCCCCQKNNRKVLTDPVLLFFQLAEFC